VQSKKKQPMRTISRYSRSLNAGKWQVLVDLVRRYAEEKDAQLIVLGQDARFAECESDRTRRDALSDEGYKSSYGLQARMWKLALTRTTFDASSDGGAANGRG
jgi:putative transposase